MAGDELNVPSQRNNDTRDATDPTDRSDKIPRDTHAADRDPTDRTRNDRDLNDMARNDLGRTDPNVIDTGRSDTERVEAERSDALHTDAVHGDVRKGDAERAGRSGDGRVERSGGGRDGTDRGAVTASPAHTTPESPVSGRLPVRKPGRDGTAPPDAGAPAPKSPSPATPAAEADREPAYRDGPYANGGVPERARPGETAATHAVPGEAAAHAAPGEVRLFERDPAEVQARWRDLQASFVDDPGDAVQRADGLVGEVVESLTSTLNSRTAALRDRWQSAGDSGTEEMRQALREYRDVLERLLALSGGSPSQSQIRK